MIDFNEIAQKQFLWVESVNWHNKTVLESLALIASELGEAADECFGDIPSKNFGVELADNILRIADLAAVEKIDLNHYISKASVSWRSKSILEDYAELLVDMAKWINAARKSPLEESFSLSMGIVVKRIVEMADKYGVDLENEIANKMEINRLRGTRGRRI